MNAALADAPLDAQAVAQTLRSGGHGAIVVFEGIVRKCSHSRTVVGLEYEAYAPLAIQEFGAIVSECAQQFVADVRIVHRVGQVSAGETSVVVAAAAQHREAAFAACRYAIDELKRRAPIWKRERFADGSSAWTPNA